MPCSGFMAAHPLRKSTCPVLSLYHGCPAACRALRTIIALCMCAGLLAWSALSPSCLHASDYSIREIISVHPGEHQTREFVVYDEFNPLTFSPAEGFIVYSWGLSGPAGDLSIELIPQVETERYGQVRFLLLVAGYSLDQVPVITWKQDSAPDVIQGTIPINATFGAYYIGVLVTHAARGVNMPIPFAITFSVSEGKAQTVP